MPRGLQAANTGRSPWIMDPEEGLWAGLVQGEPLTGRQLRQLWLCMLSELELSGNCKDWGAGWTILFSQRKLFWTASNGDGFNLASL